VLIRSAGVGGAGPQHDAQGFPARPGPHGQQHGAGGWNPNAQNIAKVAAAHQLLTWVFYAMRDGRVRTLATAPPKVA
jgi:hypothetical protein